MASLINMATIKAIIGSAMVMVEKIDLVLLDKNAISMMQEALVWIKKYFIAISVEEKDENETIIIINAMEFISNMIQRITQLFDLIANSIEITISQMNWLLNFIYKNIYINGI
jgi:hypothetical protein